MGEDLAATRVAVATVLLGLGLAAVVGTWASLGGWRGSTSSWAADAARRARAARRAAVAFTLGVDVLLLWLQAAAMAQVTLVEALAMLPSIVGQTHLGRAWIVGALGLVALLGTTAGAESRPRRFVAAVGLVAFVGSRAAVSHADAFDEGSWRFLVECAHLAVTSLWLGVVGSAAFVVPIDRGVGTAADRLDAARAVRRLSATATGALLVVAGTGLVNAGRGLGSAADLTGSVWGLALLVKVGFVAGAVALGGFNRWRVMPGLLAAWQAHGGDARPLARRFVRVLRIETFVLFAALVAAAVLGASPLPVAT